MEFLASFSMDKQGINYSRPDVVKFRLVKRIFECPLVNMGLKWDYTVILGYRQCHIIVLYVIFLVIFFK